ncbi:MAG: hypothetical protein WCO06_03365 [Candidatus Roizmanbacteria bacterium]
MKKLQKLLSSYGLFILLSFFLALFACQNHFTLDDYIFISLPLNNTIVKDMLHYFYDWGLFRPLGIIYFYVIYSIYLQSPFISYLIPLLVHICTGLLVAKVLSSYLSRTESICIGILYCTIPFLTEQYAWLAGSNILFTNLSLILQLFVITRYGHHKNAFFYLVAMQTIGVLFYETIFFTWIPIGILYYVTTHELSTSSIKQRMIDLGKLLFILSLPCIIYFSIRTFIFPPHVASMRLLPEGIQMFTIPFINARRLIEKIDHLFVMSYAHTTFWQYTVQLGIKEIYSSIFAIVGAVGLLELFFFRLYKSKREALNMFDSTTLGTISFVFAFFTIFPAMFHFAGPFPFRVLGLPFFFIITGVFLRIRKYIKHFILYISPLLIVFFLLVSIGMLSVSRSQYHDDTHFISSILKYINDHKYNQKTIHLVIQNMPSSTSTGFDHDAYGRSCIVTSWCVLPAFKARTTSITDVSVNPTSFPEKKTLIMLIVDGTHWNSGIPEQFEIIEK